MLFLESIINEGTIYGNYFSFRKHLTRLKAVSSRHYTSGQWSNCGLGCRVDVVCALLSEGRLIKGI